MPIDALTRAFGAGYGRVKKDEHQREHGGLRQFVGEHGGASFFKFLARPVPAVMSAQDRNVTLRAK